MPLSFPLEVMGVQQGEEALMMEPLEVPPTEPVPSE